MTNTVAIVGRPNVGKSTLYNRFAENNKSITDDSSGTTRDRHYGLAEWNGLQFTIVDTGGYVSDDTDIFNEKIRKQIQISLKEADIIVFVVDCKTGLTGQDQEFAKIVRSVKKPIIIVANKADNVKLGWVSNEFYGLGFGEPFEVSAANGSGTGELLDELVSRLDHTVVMPTEEIPRIAILGRPNVGKSSFVNALLGEERCVASDLSGTTRDAIDAKYQLYGHNIILTDTAGIRKKNKEKEDIEFYSVMRSINAMQRSDVSIIMIDAVQGVEGQDITLLSLAYRYKKGVIILVNKWDLIEKDRTTHETYKKALFEKIKPLTDIPVIFVSAKSKQRILEAVSTATEVYKKLKTKIPTSKLNAILLPIIENYPPPAIKGKYVKIKYITQLPTHSITIAFFCNLPQYIKPPYKSFLENQIRKNFDFKGVPISLVFRQK